MFEMGLNWARYILKRRLLGFLMSPNDWIQTGLNVSDKHGITDAAPEALLGSRTACVGITDFSVFPPQHILLEDPPTVQSALYYSTVSMRIFPFFRSPAFSAGGVWGLLLDGGFSAVYSVPEDAPAHKVTGTLGCPDFFHVFTFENMLFVLHRLYGLLLSPSSPVTYVRSEAVASQSNSSFTHGR